MRAGAYLLVFCRCILFFCLLFSKVFPHRSPVISGGYSIFPFSQLPHFPDFPLFLFSVVFHPVLIVNVLFVFQGGSPMIDLWWFSNFPIFQGLPFFRVRFLSRPIVPPIVLAKKGPIGGFLHVLK